MTEIVDILQHKIDGFKCETFTFTFEYRVDLCLTACGYALIKFKEMAKRFREKHDPVKCLDREKDEYLYTSKQLRKKWQQEFVVES